MSDGFFKNCMTTKGNNIAGNNKNSEQKYGPIIKTKSLNNLITQ